MMGEKLGEMAGNLKAVYGILKKLNYVLDKRQKCSCLLVFFLSVIGAWFELMGIGAVLPFIQAVLTPEKLLQNRIINSIVGFLGITKSNNLIIMMGIAVALVYLGKNIYLLSATRVKINFSANLQKDLAVKMLSSYFKRPYEYFLDINSADVIRGCSADVGGTTVVISTFFMLISESLMVMLVGGYIIYTDPLISIGALGVMLFILLVLLFIFKPIVRDAGKRSRKADWMRSKHLLQAVHGVKEMYVLRRQSSFIEKYRRSAEAACEAQKTNEFVQACPDRIIESGCVCGLILVVCIRISMKIDMVGFIPKLAVFAMAAFRLMPSVSKLANCINTLVFHYDNVCNVYNIMHEAEGYRHQEIKNRSDYGSFGDELRKVQFQNNLTIENVDWQYQNQNMLVLSDVSLTIYKGQSVAFIGASGAGKTTLSDIILGLLKPEKGTVKMDGLDVHKMPEAWSHIVGYVPQAVYLIDDTVRNNIAFGLTETDISDQKIWDSLEKAQLKEFIMSLPAGLDTLVGERGVKFSGGQRQRVAIARALYNKPEILVMDEATAALDNETETAVMEAINTLRGHVTLIIVAHRLSTIQNCDVIYEIKDGKAVLCEKKGFKINR